MSGQDPSIEKRLLLAIILSMLILLGAPYFFEEPAPAEPVTEPTSAGESAPVTPAPPQAPESEVPTEPAEAPAQAAEERRGEARRFTVESDALQITFDSRGAVIDSIVLKNYQTPTGEPLQLLPLDLPREQGRPLQLSVGDDFIDQLIGEEAYAVTGAESETVQAPARIDFHLSVGEVTVRKSIQIPRTGYELLVETEVLRGGRESPHRILVGPGLGQGLRTENDFIYPAAVWRSGGVGTHYYEGDLDDGLVAVDAPGNWAGVDSKYFALVLLSPDIRGIEADLVQWQVGEEERFAVRLRAETPAAARHRLFVGPKEAAVLSAVDPTLRDTVDYGWFAVLVEPLLFGLRFFYGLVGNYGWAIIALTFAINLALFPLRYKQMASMSKMSALQPKIKSIQDRYKRMKRDDPRKQNMNQEVMALYKEHGVNPLGGCLPLFFQMPILFAFYRMLDQSIELRGAPFMGWIQDLSQPDPYLITPVLMGATMVLQQKMTPAAGDPAQRRMMMFLPVVFTFMFLWVSSGLALYFLFSNVFAMMFQFLLQKWKPETLAAAPAKGPAAKKRKAAREGKK